MGSFFGEIPSTGFNPARTMLDPNDPDYLKKLSMAGVMEGLHEQSLPSEKPVTPDVESRPQPKSDKEIVGAAQGKEKGEIGKQLYAQEKPEVTAKPNTPEYFEQSLEQSGYAMKHPWGADVSAHPGVLGKIGHGLAEAGNIAGDIFAPKTMALIPGTDLNRNVNRQYEEGEGQKLQQQQLEQQRLTNESEYRNATLGINKEKADTGKERADVYTTSQQNKLKDELANKGYTPQFDENGNLAGLQRLPGYQAKESLKEGVNPATGKLEYYDTANKEWIGLAAPPKTPSWKTVVDPNNPQKSIYVDANTGKPTGFTAPPSWSQAMAGTRTTTIIDPETGVSSVYQYNPQEGTYSKYLGTSAGGGIGTQSATAVRAQDEIPKIQALIGDIGPDLGPVMGRWNDFMTGKVGTGDPRFEALRTHLEFAAAAAAKFHLNSVRAVQKFDDLASAGKMTPEVLNAYLDTINEWAGEAVHQAEGKNAGKPQGGSGGIPSFGDWKQQQGKQ